MQQILLVQNPLCVNTSSIEFAAYIANLTKSCVYGLLIEQPEKVYAPVPLEYAEENINFNNSEISDTLITENRQLFEDVCKRRNVNCTLQYIKGSALDATLKESRFSDNGCNNIFL